ncbi:hypothetical protein EVAR_99037_1 [Eumeta japonica]|uniref:Secreted protein n=1 Tax=Eumeta variegata TaxID=151549 RepID=A0A4C1XWN1_EUMVA|nr:hypothetical protein EVAR_99037_1 [Eumeta japonica]
MVDTLIALLLAISTYCIRSLQELLCNELSHFWRKSTLRTSASYFKNKGKKQSQRSYKKNGQNKIIVKPVECISLLSTAGLGACALRGTTGGSPQRSHLTFFRIPE